MFRRKVLDGHDRGVQPWTASLATLLALLALLGGAALAQDQDPLAGTTIEALGSLAPSAAPGRALVFLRITMEPGTEIPAHHHPGAVVVVVESGVFGTRLIEGSGTVMRYAGIGGEALTEEAVAGSETTLEGVTASPTRARSTPWPTPEIDPSCCWSQLCLTRSSLASSSRASSSVR